MDLVLRSVIAFLFILLITRIVGRRELSTLEPFDLILLVVIGDLVQQGVTQNDESITGIVVILSVITLMTAGTAYVNFRFPRARPIFEGRPVVLVENGRPIEANLKRERVTLGELEAEGRIQQVPEIAEIRLAVLETNGRISVIPREKSD
jgi:uncharacterized membrane protein YcaP (DUF421 family)